MKIKSFFVSYYRINKEKIQSYFKKIKIHFVTLAQHSVITQIYTHARRIELLWNL